MPTITIRLSATEKGDLESAARRSGQNVSDYVREALALRDPEIDWDEVQRRLRRLETLANID